MSWTPSKARAEQAAERADDIYRDLSVALDRHRDALRTPEDVMATLGAVTRLFLVVAIQSELLARGDTDALGFIAKTRAFYAKDLYQVGTSGSPAVTAELLGYMTARVSGIIYYPDGRVEDGVVLEGHPVTITDIGRRMAVGAVTSVELAPDRQLFYDPVIAAPVNATAVSLTAQAGQRRVVRGPAFVGGPFKG